MRTQRFYSKDEFIVLESVRTIREPHTKAELASINPDIQPSKSIIPRLPTTNTPACYESDDILGLQRGKQQINSNALAKTTRC